MVFNWHGGEPTLLGLDFYRKVVEIQGRYAGTTRIENDLQTNGLLLDESWCEFLKQHRFRVGLSIDGPKHLHDAIRRGKGGEPSFDQVYRAARLLRQYEIPFNPLAVISAVNARHPVEVYRFLTEDLGCSCLRMTNYAGDVDKAAGFSHAKWPPWRYNGRWRKRSATQWLRRGGNRSLAIWLRVEPKLRLSKNQRESCGADRSGIGNCAFWYPTRSPGVIGPTLWPIRGLRSGLKSNSRARPVSDREGVFRQGRSRDE